MFQVFIVPFNEVHIYRNMSMKEAFPKVAKEIKIERWLSLRIDKNGQPLHLVYSDESGICSL